MAFPTAVNGQITDFVPQDEDKASESEPAKAEPSSSAESASEPGTAGAE